MMYHYYGYGPGYGMGEFGVLGLVWHVVGIVISIVVIVWILRMVLGRGRHGRRMHGMWQAHSALELLNERYAKGEIEKAEYEERKKTLLG